MWKLKQIVSIVIRCLFTLKHTRSKENSFHRKLFFPHHETLSENVVATFSPKVYMLDTKIYVFFSRAISVASIWLMAINSMCFPVFCSTHAEVRLVQKCCYIVCLFSGGVNTSGPCKVPARVKLIIVEPTADAMLTMVGTCHNWASEARFNK